MAKAPTAATAKAHQLIDGASFGPDALKAIGEAFDAAWAAISANFGNDPVDTEMTTAATSTSCAKQATKRSSEASSICHRPSSKM